MALFVWLKGRKKKQTLFQRHVDICGFGFYMHLQMHMTVIISLSIGTLEMGVKLRPLCWWANSVNPRSFLASYKLTDLLLSPPSHTLVSSRLFYITLLYNEVKQDYALQSNQSQQIRREILGLQMKCVRVIPCLYLEE